MVSHPGKLTVKPPGRKPFPALSGLLIVIIFIVFVHPVSGASEDGVSGLGSGAGQTVSPALQARLAKQAAGEKLAVIVTLKGGLDPIQAAGNEQGASRQERVIRSLQARAQASRKDVAVFLNTSRFTGKIAKIRYFWIFNGFSMQAAPEVIQALAAHPQVERIDPDEVYQAPAPAAAAGPAWNNLGKVGAPLMWGLGFRGQGVVVANMDTGVDYTHPELQAQWRGGNNSWFDPYGEHATPTDLPAHCVKDRGHGTATMGVMVGKTVGVAPDAQWIAVKIFNDNCVATTGGILAGFEWLLDPDLDPGTADAPQVVNSSWGGGKGVCSVEFQPALQALRAAGILPVFSAGNYGPAVESGAFPGTNPEAFPVGATDSLDTIASFSSRGPNVCGQSPVFFPALAAPGVDIYTTAPGGAFATLDGTSFAAPHAAGALALLLSASPQGLSIQQQELALQSSALDLGAPGLDDVFGYGRLDVMAAFQWLQASKLSFSSGTAVVAEDGGPLLLTLQLEPPSDQPVTVSFSANGGTAAGNGIDYSLPTSVTFNPQEIQKTFPVDIAADSLPEEDETFVLRMVNPVNAVPADPTQDLTVTILDNDPWQLMLPLVIR